jgi:molybdopterin-binding protein
VEFKLNGENPGKDGLFMIKSDSIVLTNEMPVDSGLNRIRGKISEIIPSEFGMEVTIDAGDLFYVNVLSSELEKLSLVEEKEVWMSFSSKNIVIISGNI